ncbi:MAG: hypothetical protein AAFV90_13740 [Cyanobacteria bacterium J06634_5]
MISVVLSFLVGALSSGLLVHFYERSHWKKRTKQQVRTARQALVDQHTHDISSLRESLTSAQQDKQRRQADYEAQLNSQLDNQRETYETQLRNQNSRLKTQEDTFRRQLSALNQQLTQQTQQQHSLNQEHTQQLKAEHGNYAQLQTEYKALQNKDRDQANSLIEQQLELETRNQALTAEIQRLILEQSQLRKEHSKEMSALIANKKDADSQSDIDFELLTHELFPSLQLLRDSVDEIKRNKKESGEILCRLLALENKNFNYSKKVHSTGGYWSECKPPHLNMIRLYYYKSSASPSGKCEVLISRKKDRKTQEKDLAWLRQRTRKR